MRSSALNAALCIAGERECPTGQPRTPARGIGSAVLRRLAAGLLARLVVARDRGVELLERPRELVRRRLARVDDVEEVLRTRRVGRGLDRGEARVADRAG